jgi:magnesium chelatase family protein
MFNKISSGTVLGVDGFPVTVEVDLSAGLPAFDIVGLPDAAVKEARERVRTGIRNAGFLFPIKHITVNLAPADIRKSGPSFDLPIAVGILIGIGAMEKDMAQDAFFAGELSLDGNIRPVNGILPMVLAAKQAGIKKVFVPWENSAEAALADGMTVLGLTHINQLTDKASLPDEIHGGMSTQLTQAAIYDIDFSDVQGQEGVKRALEIAAAGYHNILMIGPPGGGKTMLSRRMPTIMPDLHPDESMEITKIYSIAGLLDKKDALMTSRPFRSPHHTASYAALTGGGQTPMPGEISLAHNGVLFLDELPEFQKKVLETLRQPMEDGCVTVSRANGTYTYPSSFLLMAAMNPCPCGHLGSEKCRCTSRDIDKYKSKMSGPLLDRIDIQVEAGAVQYKDLENHTPSESSAQVKARVTQARERQQARFANTSVRFNARMPAAMVNKHCRLGGDERLFLKQAFDSMSLSARAYHKILKIARTIADLAGEDNITVMHLAEAVSYRGLDRKYW